MKDLILSQNLQEAFGPLRAELETPWLSKVFVRPFNDSEYESLRNIVIIGETGSGKTAVLQMLADRCLMGTSIFAYIPIFWNPWLPAEEMESYKIAHEMVNHLFSMCAEGLLLWIGQNNQVFQKAKPWVQNGLISFIYLYLQNPIDLTLNQIENRCTPEGWHLLQERFSISPLQMSFSKDLPQPRQIHNLRSILEGLPGVKGIWVLTDGMSSLVQLAPKRVSEVFRAFFSSLGLFEDQGFVFKVALPPELEEAVRSADSLQRLRVATARLDWSQDRLKQVVETRLQYALGSQSVTLADLMSLEVLLPWLEKYGGKSPRGWLDLLRPVVAAFIEKGEHAAMTAKDLADIQRSNPPVIRMDLIRHEVYLGYGKVVGLQPKPLRVLEYLYTHRYPCSHEELYYKASEGLDFIPKNKMEHINYVYPKEYNGIIDTALWRLRKAIEPDPKNPVYIITAHSHGTRLENCW